MCRPLFITSSLYLLQDCLHPNLINLMNAFPWDSSLSFNFSNLQKTCAIFKDGGALFWTWYVSRCVWYFVAEVEPPSYVLLVSQEGSRQKSLQTFPLGRIAPFILQVVNVARWMWKLQFRTQDILPKIHSLYSNARHAVV